MHYSAYLPDADLYVCLAARAQYLSSPEHVVVVNLARTIFHQRRKTALACLKHPMPWVSSHMKELYAKG